MKEVPALIGKAAASVAEMFGGTRQEYFEGTQTYSCKPPLMGVRLATVIMLEPTGNMEVSTPGPWATTIPTRS